MSEGKITAKKMMPLIAITWILSLITTLALVYFSQDLFPQLRQEIEDSAIITSKLANGAVTSAKILDGTVTAVDIEDGSIVAVNIAEGAVTTVKIADSAISSDKIVDNAILTVKMANGSVTSAKILDGSVTAVDLADGSVSTMKIADGAVTTSKIADYAVSDIKLAAQAIPFASTSSRDFVSTTETSSYTDMSDMSLTISLTRTSHLLIMFSVEAFPDYDERILVRAMVGTGEAEPGEIWLTPIVFSTDSSSYLLGVGSYSYNFYKSSVMAGTHTIKIQWKVTGGTGDVFSRTLTVIALPA